MHVCAQVLKAHGADLAQDRTTASAHDVAAAFVDQPGHAPASNCTQAMTPRFLPSTP